MDPSDQFALSVDSITRLRYTAKQSPTKGLHETAEQFEAVFLQRMLKAMRAAIPKSGLLDSPTTEMYTAMMDRQWAQTLAERGIGLADILVKQLAPQLPDNTSDGDGAGVTRTVAGIPVAEPQKPSPAEQKPRPNAADVAAASSKSGASPVAQDDTAQALIDFAQDAVPLIDQHIATAAEFAQTLQTLPKYISQFLQKLAPTALEASRKSGLSERLILAQAALETGWGRHETSGSDNRTSHNVFNIKATGWDGDAVEASTTEFVDGQTRQTRARFRAYDSYQDAFADYVRLLTDSPRYQPVVDAPTAEAAAYQLQATGYATDPQYANKLLAVMAHIPSSVSHSVEPLIEQSSTGALFGGASETAATAPSAGYVPDMATSKARVAQAYNFDVPLRRLF